ncbi:MAG: hypothetical protein QXG05_07010 [Nitrososphaerota archaeon]
MKRVHTAALIIIILFILVYRVLPAISNAPVFSNDAWALLADAKYLLDHGSGQLIPCKGMPTCLYAYWPYPALLTAIVSEILATGLAWSTPVITIFETMLVLLSLFMIARLLPSRNSSVYIILILLASLWFTNIFYSGFKAEMIAMPQLALLAYLLSSFKSKRSFFIASFLVFSIVATHHFTTFLALTMIAGSAFYSIINHNAYSRKMILLAISSIIIAVIYYSAQGFIGLIKYYPAGFTETLASYAVVLFVISAISRKFPRSLLYLIFAIVVLANILYLESPRLLLGAPEPSLSSFFLSLQLSPFLIIAVYGAYSLQRSSHPAYWIILAWCLATTSLVIYSFFDGAAILLGRGIIASSLPLAVLASAAFATSKRNYQRILLILGIAIASISGIYIEMQPVFSSRNIFTSESWYYSSSTIADTANIVQFLNTGNTSIYAGKLASLAFFYGQQWIQPAPYGSAINGIFVINRDDFTEKSEGFGFGIGLGEGWSAYQLNSLIASNDLVYDSAMNYVSLVR